MLSPTALRTRTSPTRAAPTRAPRTATASILHLLLRLFVPMRNQPVQETTRLAFRPAMFLGFGEFFLQMLLGFFVCFVVVVVVRWEERRG